MGGRPELTKQLDSETFQSFYYLKEELSAFCRQNGLPASGSKEELTCRIARFLDTGEVLPAAKKESGVKGVGALTKDTKIEASFVCTEKHRAFFKQEIGKNFSFNVGFQKWLKANAGKTYHEAIDAYYQILEEKKKNKPAIDRQFEYNTYIRDFFADNEGKALQDAIRCWNYKKKLRGHNRYEKSDLTALSEKG